MKTKFFNAVSLALITAMLVTSLALAAELVTAELAGTANDVTVVQGSSASFTISVTATGNVSCTQTSANPSTTTVDTVYSISAGGAVSSSTPSSPLNFFATCSSTNGPVTWTGAPTAYTVNATVSTAATTPLGNYTITLSSAAGTTDQTNPNATGGKLEDNTATTITVHVVAPPPPSDTTAPTASPTQSPAANANGWNNSDVTVTWNWTDNAGGSGIDSANCATSSTSSGEGSSLTLSASCKDLAGNTGSASYTVKVDKTAPSISGSASPLANAAGWNNGDVAVSFTCGDSLSGIASCGPNQTLSGEGAGQSVTGTAVDQAGNSANTTVSGIKIDKTAPTASASASPAPNANGWNNSDVTVSFSGSDGLSGLDSCDANVVLSGEGAGQSATGSCTDVAGNSASATASGINIDKTAPTISGSASPAPNGAGWNNSDVTVSFTCGDSLSGIASCGPNQTLSGEGAGQSVSGTAVDNADNTAGTTVSGIKIDKTAPSVSVTGVSNGATYTLGSVPTAGCSTTDALSGVAAAASLSLSGGPVGSFTATCSGASDNAGNTSSASATYTVIYNWNGFFQPIDNLPVLNKAKAGSAIPVKFSLNGNQGLGIFAAGYPATTSTSCNAATTDIIETVVTAGGSSLSYDALTDQYIYVWKTEKSWAGTCRTLTVKLADGTIHQANFNFTK